MTIRVVHCTVGLCARFNVRHCGLLNGGLAHHLSPQSPIVLTRTEIAAFAAMTIRVVHYTAGLCARFCSIGKLYFIVNVYLQNSYLNNSKERFGMKLWSRDFSLLTVGQLVSIFGNMVLSFALPLYILDISESAALYGMVLAIPYISLIITSPIGGILADRVRKQRIMFWLDAITTLIIVTYIAAMGFVTAVVPIVIVKLMALNAIQGMYMPAVQAAVPSLVPSEKLVPANAVVTMINTFSGMAGMAVAGVLYSEFGLMPILVMSAVCFAVTAVMDLLIRIPFKKQESTGSVVQIVKSDVKLAAKFMFKEKPILAKSGVVVFFLQFGLISMLIVGIPVLINQNLGMDMDMVGYSSGIMMAGGLAGGIIGGTLGPKLTMKNAAFMLGVGGIAIIPIGLVFIFDVSAMAAYIAITAASALSVGAIQLANIQFMAFIQRETGVELIGKVMSLIVILPFIASALGSFIYGLLFEQLKVIPWTVVFATVLLTACVALYAHRLFGKFMFGESEESSQES
jgi:MFS family permease